MTERRPARPARQAVKPAKQRRKPHHQGKVRAPFALHVAKHALQGKKPKA